MKKLLSLLVFLLSIASGYAQVGINTTDPKAQLDIKSSNQATPANNDGILIPKIDAFPVTNPTAAQNSMMVYLTTVSAGKPPGFYYWDNATTTWKPLTSSGGGTLDQAYDFGGAGIGKTITADAGAVSINGTDGLVVTGTYGLGINAPSGAGTKMFWNPKKAAFRAGYIDGTQWNDASIGNYSSAFGYNTTASGLSSAAFGSGTIASSDRAVAFGYNTTASGQRAASFGDGTVASGIYSTAFGFGTTASGAEATSFGFLTTASGSNSTAYGFRTIAAGHNATAYGNSNEAPSYGETVVGIGATKYIPSLNGATEFRTANLNDRLFVVGNALDVDANNAITDSERSNALVILKNGRTGLGADVPDAKLQINASNQATPASTDGIIIPKIDAFPATNPTAAQNSMMVFLTTTAAGKPPGFYYWDNPTTSWKGLGSGISNGWSLTGNAGTNPATNFIGTTDNIDLILKRNNIRSGLLGTTNTSFGVSALLNNTGNFNNAIGASALSNNNLGNNNLAIGVNAAIGNTNASQNIAIGSNALQAQSFVNSGTQWATNNVAVGVESLFSNNPTSNTNGNNNTAVGNLSLRNNTTGSSNVALGINTLIGNTTGSNNIAIGSNANVPVTNNSDQLSIANVIYGVTTSTTALGKIGIGTPTPSEKLQVSDNIKIGNNAWASIANDRFLKFGDGNYVTIGEEIADDNLSFKAKNFLFNPSPGYNGNVGIGVLVPTEKLEVAGKTKTTNFQMTTGAALGSILTSDALGNATWQTPISNSWNLSGNAGTNPATNFIGTTDNIDLILKRNNIRSGLLGTTNTSFGVAALNAASTGTNNTALGKDALATNSNGSNNTALGFNTLTGNTTGSNNIAIGSNANVPVTNNSDQLSIANVIYGVTTSTTALGKIGIGTPTPSEKLQVSDNIKIGNNAWASIANDRFLKFGDGDYVTIGEEIADDNLSFKAKNFLFNPSPGYNGNLGIGVLVPTEKLEVAGKTKTTNFQMTTGAALGSILTSDVLGNATWQTPISNSWNLSGNTGTNPATNFIGTTDNNDLILKRNNIRSGLLGTTNTSFGVAALNAASTGTNNTALGKDALATNSNGSNNTALGFNTLTGNTTGSNNIAIGSNANVPVTNNSDQLSIANVIYGVDMSTTTLGKIGIGTPTPSEKLQVSDNIKIGNNAWASIANDRFLKFGDGNFVTIGEEIADDNLSFKAKNFLFNPSPGYNGNVGIGVLVPTEKLEVAGKTKTTTFQMTTGAALGSILTSDALGNATWQTPASSGWNLTGNTGTNPTINFLGTIDAQDLIFKVNDIESGRIGWSEAELGNGNTYYGYRSGNGDNANSNVAVGFASLSNVLNGGNWNVACGARALNANENGEGNTAVGQSSLSDNVDGNYNVAIGQNVLYENIDGNDNVAIGEYALSSNHSGSKAVAIGTRAMQNSNKTTTPFDNKNVAVGYEALSGQSHYYDSSGNANTAVGFQALTNNTLGDNNTAMGTNAAINNTNASQNIAIGYNSLQTQNFENGTTPWATNNIAIGVESLFNNNPTSITNGINNTALGNYALRENLTGTNNSSLGFQAGNTITTGNNNMTLGYNAQVPSAIADNQIRLGDTDITYAGIQVDWTITSDRRWKSNIQPSNLGLEFVKKLNPVSYFRNNDKNKKTEYGFIAQELEEVLNSSGATNYGIISKDDNGMYGVRYNDLLSPMVKAIQEQQQIIEQQNEKIKTLEQRLKAIEEKLGK